MIAAPVKGDPAADYKNGANPAELAWYFLLAAMDSGFGYYGENQDDDVKPVLAINNSLAISQRYVRDNAGQDRTGPSVWVPQRWPGNPGSVNGSKAEGWTTHWFSNKFAVYTYAYDLAGMGTVNLMVRPHTKKTIAANDDTYKVVYPSVLAGAAGLSITPANVGSWTAYPMRVRDLRPVMNGVDWIPTEKATMHVLPASEVGNLYYAYLDQYRDQLVDYYIQATDAWGNITRTDIQQVYVGAGRYNAGGKSGYVESATGTVVGTNPFITAGAVATPTTAAPDFYPASGSYGTAQSVQILDATPGAVIYYTLDGSTPTTGSTVYSGPITVSGSTILTAMAVASGLGQSGVSSSTYIVGAPPPRAAAPYFTPAAGVYATAQSVAIASVTPGAVIYYTTDGTAPSTASTRYSAPVPVSASTTLRAIALASGYAQSLEASGRFVIGTAPGQPQGVTASATSTSAIGLGWTAVTGATSYLVEKATAATGPFTSAGTSAGTSLAVTGLASGTWYWFRVSAVNEAGSSTPSAVVSARTDGFVATYTTMTLRGSMNAWATTSMTLVADYTWQAQVTLAASTAYTYKYDASGAWTSGQNWGLGGTAGVAALNGSNIGYTTAAAGTYTFQFNDRTLAYTVSPPAATIPLAPTNVVPTPVSGTQIDLAWTASAGATSYTVNRGASSNGPFVVAGSPTTNRFSDTGLTPGQQYFYYLTASNAAGTSTGSVAVYVTTPTPPAAPTGLAATVVSSSRIDLSWTAVTDATSYAVYQATAAAGPFTRVTTSTTAAASVTALAGSTTYWFQVTALSTGGESTASAPVSAKTPTPQWTSTYPAMYLRGSMNSWGTTAMALTANNTWQVSVTLTGGTTYTYKYDATGTWATGTNWGDTNADGIGEAGGSNISYLAPATGTYVFQFNDSTRAYSVTPPGGVCTTVPVTFTIANANTVTGQNLYVVGSVAALGSWAPASGFALTIQGTGANATWSGTVALPAAAAIQYKYVKRNPTTGAVVWESAQTTTSGNREKTTAACGSTSSFADGSFKQ
ncbi:MAG: chitobiase/beta-hexosaminidase C-terminal domain-containing protein [Anaeromyxobacter sp.]